MNVDLFASLVKGYDVVESDWVLHGLKEGFPLEFLNKDHSHRREFGQTLQLLTNPRLSLKISSIPKGKLGAFMALSKPRMVSIGRVYVPTPCRLSRRAQVVGESLVIYRLGDHFSPRMVLFQLQLGAPNILPFWR